MLFLDTQLSLKINFNVLVPPKRTSLTKFTWMVSKLETAFVNSLNAAFSSYISKTGSQVLRGNQSYKAL